MEHDPNFRTGPDLRTSVTASENRPVVGTPAAAPAYRSVDPYGVPAGRSGLGLTGVDIAAAVCVCLMILGPLAAGAMHAG